MNLCAHQIEAHIFIPHIPDSRQAGTILNETTST